jgi:spore germination cell wall hydrolase CwlJ-like protein
MTSRDRVSLLQDLEPDPRWHPVSWVARSLLAAAGVSVCILMTALSATASVQRAASARLQDQAIADQAAIVADLARFLAVQTADVRHAFDAPHLKPAKSTEEIVAERGSIATFADFDFTEIRDAQIDAAERRCLAEAIYYEARSEPRLGQAAVADVVLNRVADRRYPDTICAVVYQGAMQRGRGCQFSFTCDGSMRARKNARRWAESEELAGAILAGLRAPVSRNATHYHAVYVSPDWSKTLTPTAAIGLHRFYKFPDRTAAVASTK